MGELIVLDNYRQPWRQVLKVDTLDSTIQVYRNDSTGETEFVQFNDEGEAIRTVISRTETIALAAAMGFRVPAA